MELYRGMSDLELTCWTIQGTIPKRTNFTASPDEAVRFGRKYLRQGKLIVFNTHYNDLLFTPMLISNLDWDEGKWFETAADVRLAEIEHMAFSAKNRKRPQSFYIIH